MSKRQWVQRLSLLFVTLSVAVAASMTITNSSLSVAQAPTPSFGDYGYTYWIGPTPQPTSVYNVFGEVSFSAAGGPDGTSRFQTYAERQYGPVISSFQKLSLRGRVYYQATGGCPLLLEDDVKLHWNNASGQKNVWILSIQNPPPAFPKYAVGKHRLTHPFAFNSQGSTPSSFFVWNNDAANPATKARWNGEGFGCDEDPAREDPLDE